MQDYYNDKLFADPVPPEKPTAETDSWPAMRWARSVSPSARKYGRSPSVSTVNLHKTGSAFSADSARVRWHAYLKADDPPEVIEVRLGSSDPVTSSRRQRKNSRHELVEKRAGLHEHREVPASLDRNECFRWRPDGIDERARKTRGSGEIFSALNDEDRNREVAGERSRVKRTGLRDQALATDTLTVEPVVDIT